jgi:hypothetical protein
MDFREDTVARDGPELRDRHAHRSQDRAAHRARARRQAGDEKLTAFARPTAEGVRNEGARG